jgi:predicted metalloprotease with PDZ domain
MRREFRHLIFMTATAASFGMNAVVAQAIYRYEVDLVNVKDDKLTVKLDCSSLQIKPVTAGKYTGYRFNFPTTVPGTYAKQNYGKYIEDMRAYDASGKQLKVVRYGLNAFVVLGSVPPHTLVYKVNDTFDAKVKEDKVFEPAGTNFEAGKNFLINAGGVFGFFHKMEKIPFEVKFQKRPELFGVTVLEPVKGDKNLQIFRAENYHKLVDCPVMFSRPDTAMFNIANTRVVLSVFNERGYQAAGLLYGKLKPSMEAIEKFLPKMPVDNYSFIVFIKDFTFIGHKMKGGKINPIEEWKLNKFLDQQNFGALEHGNSSVYFLPDFGDTSYITVFQDVAIHEFMHIVTPLNLHSERIADFDFVEPKMSAHLWLYEGVTEYFAGLIQLQGGLVTPPKYLDEIMRHKIKAGEQFPVKQMSFTQMSENVLNPPFKQQYNQVYDLGAVLAWMLDIEILYLTQGKKTLKDVVLELSEKYGPDNPFKEEDIINDFVALVHPKLKTFFDKYITGNEPVPILTYLSRVGVDYKEAVRERAPVDLLSEKDNSVKLSSVYVFGGYMIKKVGKEEKAGLKKGDFIYEVDLENAYKKSDGRYVAEGDSIRFPIHRNGVKTYISTAARFKEVEVHHKLTLNPSPSAEAKHLLNRWAGIQS